MNRRERKVITKAILYLFVCILCEVCNEIDLFASCNHFHNLLLLGTVMARGLICNERDINKYEGYMYFFRKKHKLYRR